MSKNHVSFENDVQFRLLVHGIKDYAIYLLSPYGVIVNWNSGAELLHGYKAEEMTGHHFSHLYTSHDQAKCLPEQNLGVASAIGNFIGEGWRVRKDGSQFWASAVLDLIRDETGQMIGFACVVRDLTEQRTARESARRTEQHLRLLIDVSEYAIFSLDTEGNITSWNMGAQRLQGYSRDEIVGQNVSVLFNQEDQAKDLPAQLLAQTRAHGRLEVQGWRLRKDGTRFFANCVFDPMRDEDGKFTGYAMITKDVSDTFEIERAKEQLRQSQKMDTIGQLTSGVAHDFNNLLGAISGSLELINDESSQKAVEIAKRAAERGAKLTHQLLGFARAQTLQPQALNLNELITSFELLLRRAGREAVEFSLNLAQDLPLCDVDAAQFQSAILNLVINARDAMPKGGKLSISTEMVTIDLAQARRMGDFEPGQYVTVCVSDTGCGMTPEVKAKAFEPFFTTKEVGQGSGLGLSQVHGFVRQSRGQIQLVTEPEKGLSVHIYLPASNGIPASESAPLPPVSKSKRGTILVVEDDPEVLEVATMALQRFGYNVYSAKDGFAALAILRQQLPIDLLFTDVVMPNGMNGVDLAQNARRMHPAIRVLLASGDSREALQMNEGLNESMSFLSKPYSLSVLAERLSSIIH